MFSDSRRSFSAPHWGDDKEHSAGEDTEPETDIDNQKQVDHSDNTALGVSGNMGFPDTGSTTDDGSQGWAVKPVVLQYGTVVPQGTPLILDI